MGKATRYGHWVIASGGLSALKAPPISELPIWLGLATTGRKAPFGFNLVSILKKGKINFK
jgi:hypothetical protein